MSASAASDDGELEVAVEARIVVTLGDPPRASLLLLE
jgi:hypothetical protein